MKKFVRLAIPLLASLMLTASLQVLAQGAALNAQFTSTPITVDGIAEAAWKNAPAQNIAICMNPALTQQLTNCKASGTVQAMWNGPLLYLFFTITDPDITTV